MRCTLVLLVACAGCASTPQPRVMRGAESGGDAVTDMTTEPATGSAPKKRGLIPGGEPAHAPPSTEPGVIKRAALNRVLDQSPGKFLQQVETEPRFVDGRFHGWKLLSFFPGDPRFAGVDLQAGDVVTRVNGRSIERPEQLMAVWDALRSGRELIVDVERNGAPRTLRWTIADK
jgi:type II secretory pathway component PulC